MKVKLWQTLSCAHFPTIPNPCTHKSVEMRRVSIHLTSSIKQLSLIDLQLIFYGSHMCSFSCTFLLLAQSLLFASSQLRRFSHALSPSSSLHSCGSPKFRYRVLFVGGLFSDKFYSFSMQWKCGPLSKHLDKAPIESCDWRDRR